MNPHHHFILADPHSQRTATIVSRKDHRKALDGMRLQATSIKMSANGYMHVYMRKHCIDFVLLLAHEH